MATRATVTPDISITYVLHTSTLKRVNFTSARNPVNGEKRKMKAITAGYRICATPIICCTYRYGLKNKL